MSKDKTGEHDSFGQSKISAEEAIKKMGASAQEAVQAYQENPSADTYRDYLRVQARFKSHVTGEKYVEPVKIHDYRMSDIYMQHNQSRNMNFYVGVLSRFKRKCLWSIPTMQVGVDKASYYFGYHPEFYKYYPVEFCLYMLQHEAHHILQDHIPRLMKNFNAIRPVDMDNPTKREMEGLKKLQTYSNVAADEAVNSILNHSETHRKTLDSLPEPIGIDPKDYGHESLWSYEEYLNSWMLDAYSLFNKKGDGSGSTGMGSGHSSMEKAMSQSSDEESQGKGSGNGEESQGKGSGSGSESIEDKIQRDFNDTTGSDGHTWLDDIISGKSSEPTEQEKEAIAKIQKEAKEKGIPVDDLMAQKGMDNVGKNGEVPTAARLNDLAESLKKQGERVLIETVRDHKKSSGRGTIPGHYLEKYDELTKVCELHWTEIFESMISDPKDAKETFRINKYNRNNALLSSCNQFGFKEDDPRYRIWVSIDTSGSMCRQDIEEGLAVVQGLQKADSEIEVTVCEFDTSIQRISEFKEDDDIMKDVVGRGGTDFNCVFHHLSEEVPEDKKPDLHIIFTDGGAPPPSESVRIPVHQMPLLWVITSTNPSYWFKDKGTETYGDILQTNK
jgi:predicted metal-dependent peptidase